MIIKFSSIILFILCHVICLADVPGNQKKTGTLTVEQAAEMVKKANETEQDILDLSWLTSIDQDVARELSHYGGQRLFLCLLYTSPSPRDLSTSRMPSSA